jgi:hypothetical protein
MAENETGGVLVARAEEIGLEIGYDSGFLLITHSAGSPPRREDAAEMIAEMERTIIASLGECLDAVRDIAVARSCAARGLDFIGRRAYIPDSQIVGEISGASASGIVVRYSHFNRGEDQERQTNATVPGASLIVIVSGSEEQENLPPSSGFSSISSDKLRGLFERARSLGLRLEHDSGFIAAVFPPAGTAETDELEETVRAFGRSMWDLRKFMLGRARGARGAEFAGRRCWVPAFGAFGTVKSCSDDGVAEVTYQDKSLGSRLTCHCAGDALVIVDIPEESAPATADQESESAWRKLLRRAFRA